MRGMFPSNATATITNVMIDSNEAGDNSGAGITVYSGAKLTMNGGTISNNISANTRGAGVRIDTAYFTMNSGTIKNNSVKNGPGGGVSCNADTKANGSFTMNGGTISGNSATANGGVHIMTCTYTYKAGTVCGNTTSNSYETHTSCPN